MLTLFERFVEERKFLQNVTPATVRWYWMSWKAATPWLPSDPQAISKDTLTSIVVGMRKQGLSSISVNGRCRCINAFLHWLYQEKKVDTLWKIPKLTEPKLIMPTFTPEQIKRFLSAAPPKGNDKRIWIVGSVILDTGLRIAEVLGLRRTDLDFDNLLIKAYGKGRKERVVPISAELRRRLYQWLKTHTYDLVFPTSSGLQLQYRNANRDLKTLCKKLKISGTRLSFHTLRHTFAVNYIRNGGDAFRLQRMLGHSTLDMTRKYVNLQTADLSQAHERLSLLSNFR